MKQPLETNGRHGVGVSTTASPDAGDMEDFSKYVDIQTDPMQAEEQGGRARRKRGKVIGGLVVLATLVIAAGIFFWMTRGGKKKIDLPVRDRSAQTDQGTARDAEDVTAQAIAEIRAASASPTSASSPAPSMITHVDAPLKTQVLEAAIDQFSELLDGRGSIGEQVEPGRSIFDNLDRAIVNPVINETGSDAQFLGQF